jgi:hypothetical protein
VPTASMVAAARAAWPNPWGDMKQAILRRSGRWLSFFMFVRISIPYGWVKNLGMARRRTRVHGMSPANRCRNGVREPCLGGWPKPLTQHKKHQMFAYRETVHASPSETRFISDCRKGRSSEKFC